ncbi:hypothetical protein L1987_48604 [Smallanthus sonchifolius]|uniref:Uncharacterized protein n=1 Tax=Smallanthus sonchifolius TaxID=185202 RepID=A0ACB9FTB2_9ASTR|nr:hypothetical protein L1987_48604 [Smallanthus sonchifolius]
MATRVSHDSELRRTMMRYPVLEVTDEEEPAAVAAAAVVARSRRKPTETTWGYLTTVVVTRRMKGGSLSRKRCPTKRYGGGMHQMQKESL